MCRNKFILSCIIFLIGYMSNVNADDKSMIKQKYSNETISTASEIAEINRRIAVLSAKLTELEYKAKISAKEAELDEYLSKNGNIKSNVGGNFLLPEVPAGLPRIIEIAGVDNKMRAVLGMPSGGAYVVRVGDKIEDFVVERIEQDHVIVKSNGRSYHLSFGFGETQKPMKDDDNMMLLNSQAPMPPIPPIPNKEK